MNELNHFEETVETQSEELTKKKEDARFMFTQALAYDCHEDLIV